MTALTDLERTVLEARNQTPPVKLDCLAARLGLSMSKVWRIERSVRDRTGIAAPNRKGQLTMNERLILAERARGVGYDDIAAQLGVSRQWVSEMAARAARKLAGLPASRIAKRTPRSSGVGRCVDPAMFHAEVARELGVSQSRAEQIEASAMAKLRRNPVLRRLWEEAGAELDSFEPAPYGYDEQAREPGQRKAG